MYPSACALVLAYNTGEVKYKVGSKGSVSPSTKRKRKRISLKNRLINPQDQLPVYLWTAAHSFTVPL